MEWIHAFFASSAGMTAPVQAGFNLYLRESLTALDHFELIGYDVHHTFWPYMLIMVFLIAGAAFINKH